MKVVVLLSGGIDSSAVAALTKETGADVVGFFIDYGQLTKDWEKLAVRAVCNHLGINFHCLKITLKDIVKSSLLGNGTEPFLPGRNAIFISLAAAYAVTIGYDTVALGARDDSGYSDQSYRFVAAMEKVMEHAYGIRVSSPIIFKTKEWVTEQAKRLGVLELTYSCWYGIDKACGNCKKCKDRLELLGHL